MTITDMLQFQNIKKDLNICLVFMIFNDLFCRVYRIIYEFLRANYTKHVVEDLDMNAFMSEDWEFPMFLIGLSYISGLLCSLYFKASIKRYVSINSSILYLVTLSLSCYLFSPYMIINEMPIFSITTAILLSIYFLEICYVIYRKNKFYELIIIFVKDEIYPIIICEYIY